MKSINQRKKSRPRQLKKGGGNGNGRSMQPPAFQLKTDPASPFSKPTTEVETVDIYESFELKDEMMRQEAELRTMFESELKQINMTLYYDTLLYKSYSNGGVSKEKEAKLKAEIMNKIAFRQALLNEKARTVDVMAQEIKDLNPASADPAALLKLKAKYQQVTSDTVTKDLKQQFGVVNGKLRKQDGQAVHTVKDGTVTSVTNTDFTELDLNGFSWGSNSSESTKNPDGSTKKDSKSVSNNVDLKNQTYTRTTTEGSEGSDGRSSESKKELKIGKDGVTRSKTDKSVRPQNELEAGFTGGKPSDGQGNNVIKETTTETGVVRGDGKLGVKRKKSHSTKVESEGLDYKGGKVGVDTKQETKMHNDTQAGIISGQDGVGAFASNDSGIEKTNDKGTTAKGSVKLGGKMVVNVKDLGGDPKKYAIVVTINTTVGLSGGLSKAKERTKGGVSGGVEAGKTVTFSRVLTEAEKDAYLKQIDMAEKGKTVPNQPGLGIISAVANDDSNALGKAMDAYNDGATNADNIQNMQDGESVEVKEEKKGNVEVSASSGWVGVKAGATESTDKTTGAKKVGENYVLSVKIQDHQGTSAGADVNAGVVGGNMGVSSGSKSGRVATVTIPEQYASRIGEVSAAIKACRTQADIDALKARFPGLNVSIGKISGTNEAENAGMNVGPLGIKTGSTASSEVTEFDDGSVEAKGNNSVGGGVSIMGVEMATSHEESLDAKVDKDGNAVVDLSESQKETNFGKSADKFVENVKNDPLGLLTGGAKTMQQDEEVEGTFLNNQAIDHINWVANHPTKWDDSVVSNMHREDWKQCVIAIRAAKGDRAKIAKALAIFVGKTGHDRREVLENVLAQGGSNPQYRFEFPDAIKGEKAKYKKLVFSKVEAKIKALLAGNKANEARTLAENTIGEIESLQHKLRLHADEFKDPSRLSAMMGVLSNKKNAIQKYVNRLKNPGYNEQEQTEVDARDRYDELLRNCMRYRGQHGRMRVEVTNLFDDGHVSMRESVKRGEIIKKLRDLHADWGAAYLEMKGLAEKYGFGGASKMWEKYRPNTAQFNSMVAGENPGVKLLNNMDVLLDETLLQTERQQFDKKIKGKHAARKMRAAHKKMNQGIIVGLSNSLNSLKMAAAMKAGKCNGMHAKGQEDQIKPEAKKLWGKGFTNLALGNQNKGKFQVAAASGDMEKVNQTYTLVAGYYIKAKDAFEQGNYAQG